MTDILINWLNNEVKLSKKTDANSFAEDFSNGYLLGEVLQKYQLQDDFDQFSQNKTSESRLNNFTRVEPILNLLGIPFDTSTARLIMTEKHGEATKIMYQLFIALNKKQKAGLTGTAMETMRPAAPAKLDYMKSLIYKERLKHLTPRQADLNLQSLQEEFNQKAIKLEKTAFRLKMEEEERIHRDVQRRRMDLMEKRKQAQAQMAERIAKINAATVEIPKTPTKTIEAMKERRMLAHHTEVDRTVEDIAKFEAKLAAILPPSKPFNTEDMTSILKQEESMNQMNELEYLKPKNNEVYINKIKKRLNEDESARNEREKRRRKVLVEQMRAHEAQEEDRREEMLVNRLMRQSQQERRIAVQLLQARHEKEIIKQNRLHQEKQYEERRLKEFEEALNKESELARLAKHDYLEETRQNEEMHAQLAAQRAEARYTKHYDMCGEVLSEVVDMACKVGEYRELTETLIPQKLWREWKSLFVSGQPLFDPDRPEPSAANSGPTPADLLEKERQLVLNEGDFQEYKDMMGEWQPPEGTEIGGPPSPNPIVGHVINRLFNMVHPPTPPPALPEFPPFPIKACILGKTFSGKSTAAQRLAETHRLVVMNVDEVIKEAVDAYQNNEIADGVIDTTLMDDECETEEGEEGRKGDKTDIEVSVSDPAAKSKEKGKAGAKSGKSDQPALSTRAKLGMKASKLLKKGKPVDDQLSVDILADAIRSVPEGSGWVLDGFPSTYPQAKLLEKALSGFDASGKDSKKAGSISKTKNSRLAPDPKPVPPAPEPVSAINVVIMFEATDAQCLKRAAGRYEAQMAQQKYHQEFKPPPEGSITGVQNQEQITKAADPAHDEQQIQTRITGFLDNWPKLEKWFAKFGILRKVDASLEETSLYLEAENVFEDTLDKLLLRGKYEPIPEPEPEPEPEPVPEPPREPTPPPEPEPQPEPEVRSTSRSSKKGSAKGKGAEKSPKRDKSGGKDDKKSARSSSGKKSPGKKGKKSKTPEPEPEPEVPVEPPGTPPPAPGTELYEYVDEPLDLKLAQCLTPHWEAIEETYIETSKHVFNDIRTEREKLIRYFYNIRKDFLKYLRRPDTKQDFIDQWLEDYNSVAEDMRHDGETMSELHQKVDDLRDRLWSICDERKAQAEDERNNIMNDGWLDDRLGIVSNHYITEMQAEVDRFQDTVQLVKDYYKAMEGPIPDEAKADYARLALVELPSTEKPGSPIKPPETPTGEIKQPTPPPEEERTTPKPPRSRSATPKGKRGRGRSAGKKEDEAPPVTPPPADAPQPGRRIPLMPRRKPGASPEAEALAPATTPGKGDGKKDKNAKPGTKKSTANVSDERSESPIITTKDPDERIIIESFENGIRALASIIAQEEALRKAAEEAELEAAMAAAAEKEKAAKGDKKGGKGGKGKSRSPSPKKGAKKEKSAAAPAAVAPTPPPTEETEEEKAKKKVKAKAREEFFAAIKLEEAACKVRLELLRAVAIKNLNDLKNKADSVYKDMMDWLGARFLKEIESIDHMSEKMRHAIEAREKIRHQIVLDQEDFLVADDIKTLRTPSPSPRPPPVEEPHPDYFTVNQLMSLYSQFSLVAKDGVVSVKSFIDIFQEFTSLTHGMEMLPDNWMNVSLHQLQDLASMLSYDGEYINWKAFMTAICQPIMLPTTDQLMDTLERFKQMDQKDTGYVTVEQYDQMDLWFEIERCPTPAGMSEPYQYNRMENLKSALFIFFADHSAVPSKLYYRDMLLFFSVDTDAYEGFLRALSVVADQLIMPDDPSMESPIYIDALFEVLHHGENIGQRGDSSRFSLPADQEKTLSMERLQAVYNDLCGDVHSGLSFKMLMEHPTIQDCISKFTRFKSADMRTVFNPVTPGGADFIPDTLSTRE